MTNAEKFKSADERYVEFKKFCRKYACGNCPVNEGGSMEAKCGFKWLYLEYKEEEPKPCPFCGHTEIDIVLSRCHNGFDACCKDCGATVIAESKTIVIEKWNRRTT